MGEKEEGLHPVYINSRMITNMKWGKFPEVNGEMLIHGDSDERLENSLGSLTFEIDIKKLKHTNAWRRLFGAVLQNNWRKYHGLPMRRRKWLK